ncbi:MAG: hemolysin, partial [Pseudomonadota bacterium]|nr:hemolysin [Pseudomonadota bacterium]
MTDTTFPSPVHSHRHADLAVHAIGFVAILTAGGLLVSKSLLGLDPMLVLAVLVYVLCALASNLASLAYHFSTWHHRR